MVRNPVKKKKNTNQTFEFVIVAREKAVKFFENEGGFALKVSYRPSH